MYSGSKFEESLAIDIDPHILVAKSHELKALKVESALQREFKRSNLFVIPCTQYTDSKMSGIGPCLRVADTKRPKAQFNGPAMKTAEKLYPQFYGEQSVYVSVDDLTIMPKGDALKYVVDHMLELRYGHDDYSVEYERHKWLPWKASVLIEAVAFNPHPTETGIDAFLRITQAIENGDSIQVPSEARVPKEVADFVLDISRRFRPDMTFSLSEDTKLWNSKAHYAPGFTPAPAPPSA